MLCHVKSNITNYLREELMTEIEKKTGMTDAECEYWDEYITNQGYEPTGPNLLDLGIKPGMASKALFFKQLDAEAAAYLRALEEKLQKSYIQIINELIHEKMAVGV